MTQQYGECCPLESTPLSRVPAPIAGSRSALIDWLRLLAIIEIVAFHIDHTRPWILFGFGLPFFLMSTVALSVGKPVAGSTMSFLASKSMRLLVPFVFWSVVYLAVLAARCWNKQESFLDALSPWMLVAGTSIHLWFLPVAFVGGFAAHLVHRSLGERYFVTALLMASLLGFVALLAVPPQREGVGWPFTQWLFSVPAIFFGFATGRAMSKSFEKRGVLLAAPLFCAVVASLVNWNLLQPIAYTAEYSLGVLLFAGALMITCRYDAIIRRLGPLSYGIYLVHPCWIFAVNFAEREFGIDLPFAAEVAVVFLLSCVVVRIMLSSKVLRRFV